MKAAVFLAVATKLVSQPGFGDECCRLLHLCVHATRQRGPRQQTCLFHMFLSALKITCESCLYLSTTSVQRFQLDSSKLAYSARPVVEVHERN